MRCPHCDGPVSADAWFCVACGHQLADAAAISAPTPDAPDGERATATVTIGSEPAPVAAVPLAVEVVDGPDVGAQAYLPHGLGRVGASPQADLHLTDPAVSRQHVELRALADGILAVDLDSKNGVFADGVRVREARLPPTGLVRLGPRTTLRVTRADPAATARGPRHPAFDAFVTEHAPLHRSLELLTRVAPQDGTVLLLGETGTGKEVLARALHEASTRAAGPYVVVDCGAVAPALLESQLFGHRRGAFTSAVDDQLGAFEAADGGTVFLDEIGELPVDLQPKLLRALEARTVRRLGEVTDRRVDVRFVAATHRDLSEMMAAGTFRADLYYRLAVIRVDVPPLRARPEDIPRLAERFVADLSGGARALAPDAYAVLSQYDWPGNARELRNVLERAVAVTARPRIHAQDLFEDAAPGPLSFADAKNKVVNAFERRYATALLARHHGNVSAAAKEAGLSRPALYALLRRTGAPQP
ncbi:MAG: sigma 54-interacting transcriptional regulator [Myxococcales bacterium]|nr:sigma 54-interacting transcriptional regulator [Myxococcales bacterium]